MDLSAWSGWLLFLFTSPTLVSDQADGEALLLIDGLQAEMFPSCSSAWVVLSLEPSNSPENFSAATSKPSSGQDW